MELAEGESLDQRVQRCPLPIDECLPVALWIAQALEEAHERGVLHRDLGPDNVHVTEEGKVKVLDFGSKRRSSRTARSPTMTRMTADLAAGSHPLHHRSPRACARGDPAGGYDPGDRLGMRPSRCAGLHSHPGWRKAASAVNRSFCCPVSFAPAT